MAWDLLNENYNMIALGIPSSLDGFPVLKF